MKRKVQYFPEIFETGDLKAAKAIILTDEGPGADTDTRWEQETPFVADMIARHLDLRPETLLLDYGCGVGRLARPLIERFGCRVIGVDISAAMRALAPAYVDSERFTVVSPDQFDGLVARGLRVDAVIAVWVLQHCFDPAQDAARLRRGLKKGGKGFVLNMTKRAVPAVEDKDEAVHFLWAVDESDVVAALRENFAVETEGEIGTASTPNMADAGAFWMRIRGR